MTVTLREATEEDLPIFFEHQLDAEATHSGVPQPRPRSLYGALGQNHE